MAKHYFAELTEKQPELAQIAFLRYDAALNQVLPGSDTHPRYEDIGEVGLAIVIGKSYPTNPYSPLDPSTIDRLSFSANNMVERPLAWTPKATDTEMLSAPMPEGIGRFTVFALAKLYGITESQSLISYSTENDKIAPGIVGFAGGIQTKGSLVATSGLWDVHDHLITTMYINEVSKAAQDGTEPRSVDEIATEIALFFTRTTSFQNGEPTEEFVKNRVRVRKLLGRINLMIADHQLKAAG